MTTRLRKNLEIADRGAASSESDIPSPSAVTRACMHSSLLAFALPSSHYELARIAILRLTGLVYVAAFATAYFQAPALIGRNGLLPAFTYMQRLKAHYGADKAASEVPTIFWWCDLENSDFALEMAALVGLGIAVVMLAMGSANLLMLAALWVIQTSFHSIGQLFWGYGWEIQLLELTFLAALLCPLLNARPFPSGRPASYVPILLLRWMLFRIMLGAGLIKIRGDQCWRDLTCMVYHYETQPIPNPLSWYLFQLPLSVQKFSVLVNHFVELIGPFLLFGPRNVRHFGGVIQVGFQIMLILSGNLSFLNYLTMIPAFACFDDTFVGWKFMFSSATIARAREYSKQQETAYDADDNASDDNLANSKLKRTELDLWTLVRRRVWPMPRQSGAIKENRSHAEKLDFPLLQSRIRTVVHFLVLLLVAYLSVGPVQNLLSTQQAMNRSFDRYHLVNTYGAFGSVGKERHEVVLLGSNDKKTWHEIEFKCKPGNVTRRPCIVAPYQLRVDWQIWFAAMQSPNQNPWLIHLMAKLMAGDAQAWGLLDTTESNHFSAANPPRYLKADLMLYKFTHFSSKSRNWWKRSYVQEYFPALSLESSDMQRILKQMGWPVPPVPSRSGKTSKPTSNHKKQSSTPT